MSVAPVVEGYEDYKMVLCDDPEDKTCEMDMQELCPSGFHLCTHLEFWTLNDNWKGELNATSIYHKGRPIGEIYCRENGGTAGQFTLGESFYTHSHSKLSFDTKKNNWFASSRPSCNAYENDYGCDQKGAIALCCSHNPKCGNGLVEAPMEECDDGNNNNEDQCLNSCTFRVQ